MRIIKENWWKKKSFYRDERGAIIVFVAIAIVPLILFAGLAIDLGQAYYARSIASSALDNAVLSAAMMDSDDHAVLTKEVQDFYAASLPSNFMGTKEIPSVSFVGDNNSSIKATVSTTVNTTFMKLGGKDTVSVGTSAQAERGSGSTPMELIIVLDNTSSMATGGRMAAMKTAATSLVDMIYGSKDISPNLFVGIVPYTTTVNISGIKNYTQWLRTGSSNQGTSVVNNLRLFPKNELWAGCVEERIKTSSSGCGSSSGSVLDDTPPVSGSSNASNFEAYFYPSTWIHGYPYKDSANHNVDISPPWNGSLSTNWTTPSLKTSSGGSNDDEHDDDEHGDCGSGGGVFKGDNDWKIDSKGNGIAAYTGLQFAERFTGNTNVGPNLGCPIAALPLSSSKATILAKIAEQKVTYRGGAFAHTGLLWAWRLLSPKWSALLPDQGGKNLPQSYKSTKKIIVLMSGADNHWEDWDVGLPGLPNVTLSQMPSGTKKKDVDYINSDGDYTGYGRLAEDRIDANGGSVPDTLNKIMAGVCKSIKSAATNSGASADNSIVIYTITFGGLNAATKKIYSDCASKNKSGAALYFDAPTEDNLKTVFKDIAQQLSNVRLSWPGNP